MVQSSMVGVFFAVGLVCGVVFTFIVTSYTSFNTDQYTLAATTSTKMHRPMNPSDPLEEQRTSTDRPPRREKEREIVYKQPLSHDELDKMPVPDKVQSFDDEHKHHDDSTEAERLYKEVRVLCWVMTSPENLEKKARHVKATWAKRCNKVLYVSDKEDKSFPTIGVQVQHGRNHLTAKTMAAFDYVYKNHMDDADWFLKADDDTFVIVENLRYFLSSHSPDEPVFFGHHFKVIVKQGYFSGGGGYALSKEALRRFGARGAGTCASDFGAEDVEIGRCMESLGVKTGDSRDALGRSRFHCFNPETHLRGGYPDWYRQYDKYGAQHGPSSMSDYPVTFHYVSVELMYDLEYYVYHMRPYGIQTHDQDLNRHDHDPNYQAKQKREAAKSAQGTDNNIVKKPEQIIDNNIEDKNQDQIEENSIDVKDTKERETPEPTTRQQTVAPTTRSAKRPSTKSVYHGKLRRRNDDGS